MSKNIVLYGTEWCADCHRVRRLLEQHQIDYEYHDIDQDAAARQEHGRLTGGKDVVPVLRLDDRTLEDPTNPQLFEALGITQPQTQTHDVVIVGAGPAALSAAIYTTREDIDTLLFERGAIGGLAAVTDMIDNYPGFPQGVEGLKLADALRQQAERFGAVIELGEVNAVVEEGRYKRLDTTSGHVYARAVLIATGSDYKKLGVPGEQEYYARGVHYCATCDGAFYRGKRLVVVGGGNSAVQETIFLTRFASHIDLLVRSSIKASEVLQHELQKYIDAGSVTVHLATTTEAIIGQDGHVTHVRGTQKGRQVEYAADGVFVFVGLSPNSQFLRQSIIRLDQIGFVLTDQHLQTNMPGVFAAGDIRSGATMQIASAAGEGATAALMIREYLEGQTHPAQN